MQKEKLNLYFQVVKISIVGKFNVQGNVIDSGWFQNLRHDNGKANLDAIVILSEIIYWYKPIEVIDETTDFVWFKI